MLADEMAPLVYDAANFSYDPKHHDPRGRMVYRGYESIYVDKFI